MFILLKKIRNRENSIFPFVKQIYQFIYASYAKLILKDTWGRKRGDKSEKETLYIASFAF